MKFASVVSLLSLLSSASAYSTGAGRCVVGEAAPKDRHSAPPNGEQSLAEGGYTISVGGTEVTDAATVTQGTPFDVTLSGADFKGFLILADITDTSALDIDETVGKPADGTGCDAWPAVTHMSNDAKTSVTATATIDAAASTTLDISLVVDGSQYYYTQIALTVEAAEPAEVVMSDMPSDIPSSVPNMEPESTDPPSSAFKAASSFVLMAGALFVAMA